MDLLLVKELLLLMNKDEAIKNLREMLLNSKFGKSSEKVIIEEFLRWNRNVMFCSF